MVWFDWNSILLFGEIHVPTSGKLGCTLLGFGCFIFVLFHYDVNEVNVLNCEAYSFYMIHLTF